MQNNKVTGITGCNDINPEAIVAAKESALASVPDKYIKEKEMVKDSSKVVHR